MSCFLVYLLTLKLTHVKRGFLMEVLTGEAQRQLAMQAKHRDLPIRAAWSDLPVISEDHKASKLTPDIYMTDRMLLT